MKIYWKNFIRLFPLAIQLFWQYRKQSRFLKRNPQIIEYGSIVGKNRAHSYAMKSIIFLCGSYELIHRPLNTDERTLCSLLAVFSPLYDDSFDNTNCKISLEDIKQPEKSTQQKEVRELITAIQLQLARTVDSRNVFWETVEKLHTSQEKASILQSQSGITRKNLVNICNQKGAFSALLFRTCLDIPFLEGEEEAIKSLGAWIQHLDDLFDIHDDIQNSIQTAYTQSSSYIQSTKIFRKNCAICQENLKKIKANPKKIKILQFRIFAFSMLGEIILAHLRKLEKKHQKPYNSMGKEIICKWWTATSLWKGFLIGLKTKF